MVNIRIFLFIKIIVIIGVWVWVLIILIFLGKCLRWFIESIIWEFVIIEVLEVEIMEKIVFVMII